MLDTLSRRLHIRDDGTGKPGESDGTFAEFETEEAIILLGEPGMGKTTFFKAAAQAHYTTVRRFLVAPHAAAGEALFLDGLDEHRTIAGGQNASDEVARALCSLGKPRFRLSCRAADWFGEIDQEVLRVASASGRVVVLELRPLSHDEILQVIQGMVPDPAVFLGEVEAAGLGKLLGNPQTLTLVAQAWRTGRKPQNKLEAYDIGISDLLKETNRYHVTRGATAPVPHNLRQAAGAAAATLLLSNAVGIARTELADGDGYVGLAVVPHPNRSDLEAVLKRRVFMASEVDRFEPIHRTIAEFLAAEDLAQRITDGLPIDRVMALMCGFDGRPVASLRGLFAWLMCRLGHPAEDYVERDPYGVVMYGDASVLLPAAQGAIWHGLRELREPWFLTNEEDRGAFRDLANPHTANIISTLLQDPATGVHLHIAALEAVANSPANEDLSAIIRNMVLTKHSNTWLRSTAVRAFARSVQNDWAALEVVDDALAQATDDLAAPAVRVVLLCLTPTCGNLSLRLLSILEQAAAAQTERRTLGDFYPLLALPSEADVEVILDGASRVLLPANEHRFELQFLFNQWLKRRLEGHALITPVQLARWLQYIRVSRDRGFEKTLAALKTRLGQQPALFEEVFTLLAKAVPNDAQSFHLFVVDVLGQLLPEAVWPVPPSTFFLARAEQEHNVERAADLFRMYLAWLPQEGIPSEITEAGFAVLERRHDVAQALGHWQVSRIDTWRINRWKRREEARDTQSVRCAQSVTALTPRLTTIRAGVEADILAWASMVYQGFCAAIEDISDARARLISVTNDEIADACIEGFIRYAEKPTIPTKEAVIESWLANSIPYTHSLLSLSVFLRLTAGMTVPQEALPHCLAAVVTAFNTGDKVPGYDKTLSGWLIEEARQHPAVVRSVLNDMWDSSTVARKGQLPGFDELAHDPGSQQLLASLSADVLRAGIMEDHDMVSKLVSVLLRHDPRAALTIGKTQLERTDAAAAVRAIWSTALFLIDPHTYLEPWKTRMAESETALWEAMAVIGGALHLTAVQRMEVILLVGQRFAQVAHPRSGWLGSREPWNSSEFVANQIKLLAADDASDVQAQFERLEHAGHLTSYRDLIRHHRAQHARQQRESRFTFASPAHVAEALWNRAPATASDLLAFIVDHLSALAYELTRTQSEGYRAYWNEKGRDLIEPKWEEVCSGFLAEDLQHRVQVHGLSVEVERHMTDDKECDLAVLQGTERLLPIEVKHHYNAALWTACAGQLDRLYTRDAKASGCGIYLVLWSGEAPKRKMPKLPEGLDRPTSAAELKHALESRIAEKDRHRLRVVVVDIAGP